MKLDAWMEQGHSLEENLRLIESLSQAVNAVHDRGEALGGLQPDRIEVEAGDRCGLSEAKGGTSSPDYAPPDGEGDSTADVYAVGKIAWEILAERPGGDSPQHLSEVRPDISKELADAIMACLERSADWRPKDLTFLAQMAAARQAGAARSPQRARGTTRTSRRTPARRTRSHQQGRRTWPLLAALVVVLGLAAFAWRQFAPGGFPWTRTSPAQPTPPPVATPGPEPAPPAAVPASPVDAPTTPPATETAADEGGAAPSAAPPPPAPPPSSEPQPASQPEPEPVAPPATVATAPAVAPPPVRTAPAEPPATSRPAPPAPAPATTRRAAPETARPAPPPAPNAEAETAAPSAPPEAAPPAAPAVLTAVSPLEVKRPGKVLVDLRGQGFLDQHVVRILPVKKVPRGISVVRHKRVNDTLITVLIELTKDAETGEYAFAVEDGFGQRTDSVIFTVTK